MITPSEVAREDDRDEQRGRDQARGLECRARRRSRREESRVAEPREPQQPPAEAVEVDLEPGEEEQEREPYQARIATDLVDLDPAEPRGPTTIPATISSTTAGSRRPGASPSTNGAANPSATMISRSVKPGSGIWRRSPAGSGLTYTRPDV